MTQERSSSEFVGVRRGRICYVKMFVAKVETLVIKMQFYFLRAVFPCVLEAKTSKHT